MILANTKRTRACNICRRRKGRCEGGYPCNWCVMQNLQCDFSDCTSPPTPSSSPTSPSQAVVLHSSHEGINYLLTEQGMLAETELNQYLYLSLSHFPTTTILPPNVINHLLNANTTALKFLKYALCTLSARSCGNAKHTAKLLGDTQQLAVAAYNEKTVETLAGFAFLGVYWLGIDEAVTKKYASTAASVYGSIVSGGIPSPLQCAIMAYHTVFSPSIPAKDKIKMFLMTSKYTERNKDAETNFALVEIRLFTKIFGHTRCMQLTNFRSDLQAVLLCHSRFTEAQRRDIFMELSRCKDVRINAYKSQRAHILMVVFDFIEIIVNWKSGHVQEATELAVKFAESCEMERFLFGTRFEAEFLLVISVLLHDQKYFQQAQKLHQIASTLHSLVRSPPPLLQCADTVTAFIIENLSSPFPQIPTQLPSNEKISSMVSHLLSLATMFLPNGDSNALISTHGLIVLVKALAPLCSPAPSLYELDPFNQFPMATDLQPMDIPLTPPSIHQSASPMHLSPTIDTPQTQSAPIIIDSCYQPQMAPASIDATFSQPFNPSTTTTIMYNQTPFNTSTPNTTQSSVMLFSPPLELPTTGENVELSLPSGADWEVWMDQQPNYSAQNL